MTNKTWFTHFTLHLLVAALTVFGVFANPRPAAASITDADLQKLYVVYFGRPADPTGLAYWKQVTSSASAAGQSDDAILTSVSNSFAANSEFIGLNSDGIINKVYTNLFGHAPDPSGLMYWSLKLSSGDLTLSQIVRAISDAAMMAGNADGIALTSKVQAASAFTAALDTTGEILGYSGTAANDSAKSWLASINSAESLSAAVSRLDSAIGEMMSAGDPKPVAPVATDTPTLSPLSPTVGDALVCSNGTWTGSPAPTLKFAWLRGTAIIPSQNTATYVTTAADAGQYIYCKVTATIGSSATSVMTGGVRVLALMATDTPTLSPLTPAVGDALVCSNGTWTGSSTPTLKFAWLRGTAVIPGQNAATYVTTTADAGQLIYCRVTATVGNSMTSVITGGVRVLAPVAPAATVAPALSPLAPTVGDVIACSSGTWTGSPTPTLKFEWLRGTSVIPNQTAATYMTTAADVGQQISCKVTATIGNLATSVNTAGVRVKDIDPLQTIRVVVPVDIARAPAGFTQLTISGQCAPDPGLVAAAISAGTISKAPPTLLASKKIYLTGGAFKQDVTLEYYTPASLRSLYTTSEVRIDEFDRLNSEGTPAEGNLGVNVVPLN